MIEGYKNIAHEIIAYEKMLELKREEQKRLQEVIKQKNQFIKMKGDKNENIKG